MELTTDYTYYPWNTQGGRLQSLETAQATGGIPATRYSESYSFDSQGRLSSKGGQGYTYGDGDHVHAATAMGNNSYTYDENGNMVIRSLVSGTVTNTYTLVHNADNRLVGVTGAGSITTTYTYNGDFAQVIAVLEGSESVTTTLYIGSYYEYQIVEMLTSTAVTTRTYYFAGSTRVALCENGTLIYLLSDHLGSTSMTTDASGGVLSVQKYMPYGEVRQAGGLETDYTYTGQRTAAGGLMYFKARMFDPSLGRFLEADSIVPGAGNPMAFDRYMYVFGNSLRYVDPSGHDPICTLSLDDQCIISQDGGRRIYHLPGSGSSKNNKEPWKNHPDYDPLHDAILNWGDPTGRDHDSRRQRSGAVWSWICQSGGWWGTGCPSAYDLTVWLLWQEVGLLFANGVYYDSATGRYDHNAQQATLKIITYMRDLFEDGVDALNELPIFTAFFNPDSGGSFTSNDWAELMTKPINLFFSIVDQYWNKPNPHPNENIVWRVPNEVNGPRFTTHLLEVTNSAGNVILQVGIR